jgi:hypothetical protein
MENLTESLQKLTEPKLTTIQTINFEDILTEQEKADAVDWEIGKAKQNLIFRLTEKGMPLPSIELRIAQTDWNSTIDRAEVLAAANRRKHFRQLLADDQESRKVNDYAKMVNLIQEWDARKFYETIKSHFITRLGTFKGHLWQKDYIRAICLFLSHDARFMDEIGHSFEKGILVKGKSGLGKTEVIRAISANPIRPIKIISILDICDEVKENGFCELNTKERILIDDVGTEPEVINHFGTKVNWFKDFIEKYYLHANGNFSKLLITTNLNPDEFESRYGLRVRSRMREMFNVITLNGQDLRK